MPARCSGAGEGQRTVNAIFSPVRTHVSGRVDLKFCLHSDQKRVFFFCCAANAPCQDLDGSGWLVHASLIIHNCYLRRRPKYETRCQKGFRKNKKNKKYTLSLKWVWILANFYPRLHFLAPLWWVLIGEMWQKHNCRGCYYKTRPCNKTIRYCSMCSTMEKMEKLPWKLLSKQLKGQSLPMPRKILKPRGNFGYFAFHRKL